MMVLADKYENISYLQGRMVKYYWECEVFDKSLLSLCTSDVLYVGLDELTQIG